MTDIVGLQLYTIRDETARDFKATIRRVAEIGYLGVEFAGYGGLSDQEVKELLTETGLTTVGTHVGLHALEANFEKEVQTCLEIGSPFLIVPWVEEKWRDSEGVKKLAERLNEYGHRTQKHGITIAYHNHDFEFEKKDASTLLDNLIAATDPVLVKFELDTYWAAYAGIDVAIFINKHAGRFASLHIKDMTPERTFTEVGDGVLPIATYIEAAKAGGTHIFIVENDQPAIPSLESAKRSYENMHSSLT